jgi:hypothetical protein
MNTTKGTTMTETMMQAMAATAKRVRVYGSREVAVRAPVGIVRAMVKRGIFESAREAEHMAWGEVQYAYRVVAITDYGMGAVAADCMARAIASISRT